MRIAFYALYSLFCAGLYLFAFLYDVSVIILTFARIRPTTLEWAMDNT